MMDPAELEALRQTFVAETKDQLDELDAALMELAEHPGDRVSIRRIFQITHTLKGTAASLGYKALAELGHAMKDVIKDLERRPAARGDPQVFLLREGTAAARQMLPDALSGIDRLPPTAESLLERLRSRPGRGGAAR